MRLTMGISTAAALAIAIAFACRSAAALEVPNPAVSAVVTGGSHGQPFGGLAGARPPAGFLEEERFFSGTATSYTKSGDLGRGRPVDRDAGATAPFNVRMLIRRPTDAAASTACSSSNG